mmetsp:Transcript_24435/g.35056  ORF Transcript_24435/g.35056 Transcript_24435/m.35056 type:complete len:489 (+) Transcript_24435:38-1504(+)
MTTVQYSTEGCNFGVVTLKNSTSEANKQSIIRMNSVSAAVGEPIIFDLKVENIALCVVPANNRDEIEIQFAESEERKQESLVQVTFHFPSGEDEEGITQAENLHREIMDTGVLRSVTGDIITEFTKEQGNFVTPRGKYAIQMTSSYMHMQGAQYAYKIKYEDINCLFHLPKIDGGRVAFVISLNSPIRQGNQKYQHLVLETHKVEHTQRLNLTEEEIQTKYKDHQLSPVMTAPTSSLIAKVFKALTQKKVFIPKQYVSARDAFCVRCSIKANDGLLYPLAKSFIFIHKPTILIAFEDIDFIEFKRYEPVANSATRNFDLVVNVRAAAADETKEYAFLSIDRSEYSALFDYLSSKDIKVRNPQQAFVGGDQELQLDGGSDDESEEDGDYEDKEGPGESSSGSESGSEEGEEAEDQKAGRKGKERQEAKDKPAKAAVKERPQAPAAAKRKGKEDKEGQDGGKKKRAKKEKDKNAPKGEACLLVLNTAALP